MIIANIVGGLGNQMFQYAAGRALSIRKNTSFALDVSAFASYNLHHGFELARVFSCNATNADSATLSKILGWQTNRLVRRLVSPSSMACFRTKHLAIEPHFDYWPAIDQMPDDCYLSGYWQSERYFENEAAQIRADFSFAEITDVKNIALMNHISGVNAISLHVRRGDYVNNPTNASIYAACSIEYYEDAIKFFAENTVDPHFFVFSDDLDWVKENLDIAYPVQYVDHNRGMGSHNDMRLMSLCKHNIIANSSFSWWGAWLNNFENKTVIAPARWFANQTNTKDLLPKEWIKL